MTVPHGKVPNVPLTHSPPLIFGKSCLQFFWENHAEKAPFKGTFPKINLFWYRHPSLSTTTVSLSVYISFNVIIFVPIWYQDFHLARRGQMLSGGGDGDTSLLSIQHRRFFHRFLPSLDTIPVYEPPPTGDGHIYVQFTVTFNRTL